MKKVVVFGLIFVLLMAAAAFAADTPPATDTKTIKGQVKEIDLKQNVLIIISAGNPFKLELTADTKYMIGTQGELKASSINPKDNLEIEYKVVDNKNIAISCRVLMGAKK